MAALVVKAAAEELAAALTDGIEPVLNAVAVLMAVSKFTFASHEVERELAVAMSNAAVAIRRDAREQKAVGGSILRRARECYARALALAAQDETEGGGGK
jgi:hypothetical protein